MVREIPPGKAMVLSIACLLLSVTDSDGADYFPLREGNYWIYGAWSPSRVNERTGDIVHMILDGSSMTLRDRGSEIDIELPGGDFALFYRFEPDTSWVFNDPVSFCNHESPVSASIETEPVITPAGLFRDCLRLEFERNDCLHGGYRTQWWAPDVGLVKSDKEFVGVVELTRYCLDGGDCMDWFLRGDGNTDGEMNIADAVYILQSLFAEGPDMACPDAADANDDEAVNIADAVYILQNLFADGPRIPYPHPSCGFDLTAHPEGGPDLPACRYDPELCTDQPEE